MIYVYLQYSGKRQVSRSMPCFIEEFEFTILDHFDITELKFEKVIKNLNIIGTFVLQSLVTLFSKRI